MGASASLGSLRSIRFWTATNSRTITASASGKASSFAAWIARDPIRSKSPCRGIFRETAGVEEIGAATGPIPADPAASIAIPQQGLFDRIGSLATQAAKALAFPLVLAVIVLLFVAVQNRIDRKDPKLALAPIAPDLLRFE